MTTAKPAVEKDGRSARGVDLLPWVAVSWVLLIGLYAAALEWLLRRGNVQARTSVSNAVLLMAQAAVCVLAALAALRRPPAALRRTWRLLLVGVLLTALATLVRSVVETDNPLVLQISRADWLDFASYPFYLVGLLSAPVKPSAVLERLRMMLDLAAVALATVLVLGYLLTVALAGLQPSSQDWVYLLASATAVVMVFPLLSRERGETGYWPAAVLSLGIGVSIVADMSYALLHQHGLTVVPTWLKVADLSAAGCFVWSATHTITVASRATSVPGRHGVAKVSDTFWVLLRVVMGIGVFATAAGPVLSLASSPPQKLLLGGVVGLIALMWVRDTVVRMRSEQLYAALEGAADDLQRRVEERTQQLAERVSEVQQLRVQEAQRADDLKASIDELKSTQAELLRSERILALGDMVAGAAHELNNPLTAVRGYTEILMMQGFPEQTRHDLQRILDNALRCQNVVSGLLEFGRRRPFGRVPCDVNAILERALVFCQDDLEAAPIHVLRDLDPRQPLVEGDESLLRQVFFNVILNALQAMHGAHGRGHLTISTRLVEAAHNVVRVEISDDGPGIPVEIGEKVFDPFFTTRPPGEGVGLGLSICFSIVQQHHGRIAVESPALRTSVDGLGPGTTVVIELSALPEAPVAGRQ